MLLISWRTKFDQACTTSLEAQWFYVVIAKSFRGSMKSYSMIFELKNILDHFCLFWSFWNYFRTLSTAYEEYSSVEILALTFPHSGGQSRKNFATIAKPNEEDQIQACVSLHSKRPRSLPSTKRTVTGPVNASQKYQIDSDKHQHCLIQGQGIILFMISSVLVVEKGIIIIIYTFGKNHLSFSWHKTDTISIIQSILSIVGKWFVLTHYAVEKKGPQMKAIFNLKSKPAAGGEKEKLYNWANQIKVLYIALHITLKR